MSLTGACGRLTGIWLKLRAAEAGQLGVDIGEEPGLEQGIRA